MSTNQGAAMLVKAVASLLAVAAILSVTGSSRADNDPVQFTVTTRKADDTVTVGGNQDRTVFEIKSPSGISRTMIERNGDAWPKAVVVRLHLKGLESLKVTNGKVEIGTAVGVREGKIDDRQWKGGKDETPLAADDPLRLAIRAIGKDGKPAAGIPLDGGHFEVTLPAAFFKENPKSITLEWIDFYR